ncbi:hypothetical protein HCU74_08290 [Spongiibacter sp. KMU-166]|uniref:HTH cro/C1-type domain-containing protein n=1 Tax=Spongiibacter thalassae TaxID=2721624 RepID=A0ABX1GE01_9GAMM|nr:hypothetical protein [Spongiibacter thalassae]NKI17414.1 hypothetical protein [Spongiibacter thalassae]
MKTIDDIRRYKLKLLAEEFGGQRPLADRIKKSPAQLSQLMTGSKESKTGRRRGMRPETARHIESCCGKPEGWLDTLDGGVSTDAAVQKEIDEILSSLQRLGQDNFPAVKAYILALESQLKDREKKESG